MTELHNKSISEKIVPKEGQRDLLCSNNLSLRCPSLCYQYTASEENLNRAYEILFEEVLKRRKENGKHTNTQTDSDIR
jgi:hypothetical protein